MTESDARGLEDCPNDGKQSIDTETPCYPQGIDTIALDDLYQALSNSRRRHVIRALADGPTDIGTLAEEIAAVENGVTVDAVSTEQRKSVYVVLYQRHLRDLDDWEIVDHGRDGAVTRGPAYEAARDAMVTINTIGDEEPATEPSLLDRIASGLREVVA